MPLTALTTWLDVLSQLYGISLEDDVVDASHYGLVESLQTDKTLAADMP